MTRWVPLDKGLLRDLPKDRPYTRLEAMFSLSCNYDNGETATLRGYASLWGWSTGKVERFLREVGVRLEYPDTTSQKTNQRGTIVSTKPRQSRDNDGTINFIDSKALSGEARQRRDNDETAARQSQGAILNPKPKPISTTSFSTFWTAYPRKAGKAQAGKAWQKLNPDSTLQGRIFEALEWQRQQVEWQKDGGKFIPHAATWLNGRRWEDEPPQGIDQSDGIGHYR